MSDYVERIDDYRVSLQAAMNAQQASLWTALPGVITKVDLDKMTCEAQPAIQSVEKQTDGSVKNVTLPVLVDVPLIYLHGGKYAHTDPVAVDDECLVVFSSRCIDNWWQDGGVQPQFEMRKHDLSDGLAIVGPRSQKTKLSNVSTTTSQWRNVDGDIYQELDNDNQKIRVIVKGITVEVDASASTVNITGPDHLTVNTNQDVTVTAPNATLNCSGQVIINSSSQMTINTPLLRVNGNMQVTGSMIGGFGTGDSINLQTHRHGVAGTPAAAQTISPTPGT
jgi:hypothetical protein